MSGIFPRAPKLLKGALIEFSHRFISSVPNIIVFQYNPQSMTRKLEAWYTGGSGQAAGGKEPVNAQPHDPPETFDLILEFDAADDVENPVTQALAVVRGVSDRIAALEMLLYPDDDEGGLLAPAVNALRGALGKSAITPTPVPRGKVPDLLFCWGPSRIVPVRLTTFSVEEQAYSPLLAPIRAKVTVGLKIVQPRELPCSKEPSVDILKTSYKNYINIKKTLALSSLARQEVESILAMQPF